MVKRIRLSSSGYEEDLKVGDKSDNLIYKYSWRNDWISRLSDDLLVSIISLLPGSEAVRSCVLSRRWEKLWTFTTGTLSIHEPSMRPSNFLTHTMTELEQQRLFDRDKANLISWVNRALKEHQAPTIEEFSIRSSVLDSSSASDIDTWLHFAVTKNVQRLHLNFTPTRPTRVAKWAEKYHFPPLAIRDERSSSAFKSLTQLSLLYIIVDDQQLHHFLSSCPFLTKLVVVASPALVHLRVAGPPSLKLNHLNITCCFNLESMEISAPNLVFFRYSGHAISISLTNFPKLVEAHFGGDYVQTLINHIPDHISYLSPLKALTLMFFRMQNIWIGHEIPELLNLKQLVLMEVFAYDDESLLPLTHLLKAAPFLHRFALTLRITRTFTQSSSKRIVGKVSKYSHQCLKVVELSGFEGLPIDVELTIRLLETATSLEEIILKTRFGGNHQEIKSRVKQLIRSKLPAGVRLVVLEP